MTDRRTSQPSRLSRAIRAITEPQVRRILLVDDEELIRSALAKFLRSKGYEVTTCDSGPAALDGYGTSVMRFCGPGDVGVFAVR